MTTYTYCIALQSNLLKSISVFIERGQLRVLEHAVDHLTYVKISVSRPHRPKESVAPLQPPDCLVMVVRCRCIDTWSASARVWAGLLHLLTCSRLTNRSVMAFKLTKVLISDSVDASCREILEGSGIPVDYKPGIAKDQLLSIIKV